MDSEGFHRREEACTGYFGVGAGMHLLEVPDMEEATCLLEEVAYLGEGATCQEGASYLVELHRVVRSNLGCPKGAIDSCTVDP